jgi:hypothetical protein
VAEVIREGETMSKKIIYIPKAIHDLMGPENMTYRQMDNIITILSLVQDNSDYILKTGDVMAEFTIEEYSKRREEINNGEYLISVVDENGHLLNEKELGFINE